MAAGPDLPRCRSPPRRRCQSLQGSPGLLNGEGVPCPFPQSDAGVLTLPKEECHGLLSVVGAGLPLCLDLQGDDEGQSPDPVEAQGDRGRAHLGEAVE